MTDKININPGIKIDNSLSRKVSKGALWVTVASVSARILNLASAIILARLLSPADFGLMAIATAIIAFSQGTTETGFESALIQKQDKPEDFLNIAWTFELVRYLVLFFAIFLSAPLLALFFKEPRAMIVLRVISLSLIFQGLRNIGVFYFRKNLDFYKQFVLELVPLIAYIAVVIPLAFFLRNVWALVWASLATSITTCCVSYVIHPYRPSIDFNIKKAKSLFNFGKWILGSSIVVMIREQGMIMFIGKFLGIVTLGFYNRAGAFSIMIFQQISAIAWRVGYPAYSQLQVEPIRFKNAYLKTLQLLTFIGMPMAGVLFIFSREFVQLFLTTKWLPIVPLMQILCLQGMLDFINTPAFIVFQASGNPAIGTKISTFGVMILAILVYPLSLRWGVVGVMFALFLSTLISSLFVWHQAMNVTKCTFAEFLKPVLISIVNTGTTVTIMFFIIKNIIFTQVGFTGFFGLIFVGTAVYIALAYCFDNWFNYGIYRLVMERIAVLR